MAAQWTNYENNVLKKSLVDGVTLDCILELLHSRTEGAIRIKANNCDFRIHKVKDDEVKRFYSGVKRRNRKSKKSQGEQEATESLSVASMPLEMPVSEAVVYREEPQITISNIIAGISAKDANDMAVKMLLDNGLEPTPKIVCYLSIHIMGGAL